MSSWTFAKGPVHHPPLTGRTGEVGSPTPSGISTIKCSSAQRELSPCGFQERPTMNRQAYTAVRCPTHDTTRPLSPCAGSCRSGLSEGMRNRGEDELERHRLRGSLAAQLKESPRGLRPGRPGVYSVHGDGGLRTAGRRHRIHRGGRPPRVAPCGGTTSQGVMD